jgi:hypothetical protein
MRLDHWMPDATVLVRERHAIRIAAPPPIVYRCLWETEFGGPVTSALLGIRGLPRAIADRFARRTAAARPRDAADGLTLRRFVRSGFALLDDVPDVELVLGLTGRFWTPTGGLVPTDHASFAAGPGPGLAQAAWNFSLATSGPSHTELATETRVRVAADVQTAFLRYWRVVRPFSGLLRHLMLRAVRRTAHADAAAHRPRRSAASGTAGR